MKGFQMTGIMAVILAGFMMAQNAGAETCATTTRVQIEKKFKIIPREEIVVSRGMTKSFMDRVNGLRKGNGALPVEADEMLILLPRSKTSEKFYIVLMFNQGCLVPLVDRPMGIEGMQKFFQILKSEDVFSFIAARILATEI